MHPESEDRRTLEIQSILTLLAEPTSVDARRGLLQRLIALIPVGDHPALYIESMEEPELRFQLREKYEKNLDELKLIHDWKALIETHPDQPDLEKGSYLLSRLSGDRELSLSKFQKELAELTLPLAERLEIIHPEDHEGRIGALTHYLFEELGFSGNNEDYYNPGNSFITNLIKTRKGIPVSLSVLMILISRRAGLPVYGINLPGHFVVQYHSRDYSIFLDPFNRGAKLTEDECFQFLNWQGIEPLPVYLNRTEDAAILIRMYRNLINHYSARGSVRMENILRQHFNLLQDVYLNS